MAEQLCVGEALVKTPVTSLLRSADEGNSPTKTLRPTLFNKGRFFLTASKAETSPLDGRAKSPQFGRLAAFSDSSPRNNTPRRDPSLSETNPAHGSPPLKPLSCCFKAASEPHEPEQSPQTGCVNSSKRESQRNLLSKAKDAVTVPTIMPKENSK